MIAIVVVSHNGGDELIDCLDTLLAAGGPAPLGIVVVDNASTDGTFARLHERYPQIELVESSINLGYAGGAALGWEHARARFPFARYLAVLNQDLLFARGWLEPLIAFLENTPKAAGVQPLLLLEDGKRVNTSGNRNHFLGFCFMTDYERPLTEMEKTPREIDSLSGAAFVLRASTLTNEALFNADYFMYLEDTELSWRLRQRGFSLWLVPASTVRHRYRFQAPYRFYYRLERNRIALLATYYRLSTIILIAPAWLLMEMGQWFFAWNNGLLAERAKIYRELAGRPRRRQIAEWRNAARRKRALNDRAFARKFSGTIDFVPLRGALVRYVANPVLGAYWALVRRLLW